MHPPLMADFFLFFRMEPPGAFRVKKDWGRGENVAGTKTKNEEE
jgi:hypothetical protein